MEARTFQVQMKVWRTRHIQERVSSGVARPGIEEHHAGRQAGAR